MLDLKMPGTWRTPVQFLASDEARYITAACLTVDGGLTWRGPAESVF